MERFSRWALNATLGSLQEAEGDLTWRRHCDCGGRDWRNATTSQRMLAAVKPDRQNTSFSSRPSRASMSLQTPDFSPGLLISDFWPPDRERSFCCFTRFMVICYSSHRKPRYHLFQNYSVLTKTCFHGSLLYLVLGRNEIWLYQFTLMRVPNTQRQQSSFRRGFISPQINV